MRQDPQASDFWSRRRAAVEREAQEVQRTEEAALRRDAQAALEKKTDADILAELDLPDPESLKAGDDFSVFMAQAVPDRLRRRALRVLWRANPLLANLDELLEYGEDYTDAAVVVENLQTAYQVGRGMLEHVEKMAREAEAAEETEAGIAASDPALSDPALSDPAPADAAPSVALAPDPPAGPDRTEPQIKDAGAPECEDDVAAVPAPRRMKFRNEEAA